MPSPSKINNQNDVPSKNSLSELQQAYSHSLKVNKNN